MSQSEEKFYLKMETPGSKGKGHQELQISTTTTTHVIGMFVATSVTNLYANPRPKSKADRRPWSGKI